MPINPITKEEQVYPTLDDLEHFRSIDIKAIDSEGNDCKITGQKFVKDNLRDGKYYSFLFAVANALKLYELKGPENRLEDLDRLLERLLEVYDSNPELSVWLSELIQNAVDARWGNEIGATEISIDFTNECLTFIHNGRPPQFLDFGRNEFAGMYQDNSTKKGDLKSEGRFGIGFKFWRFFFQNVSLEASGWQIEWNESLNFGEIMESEFTEGMRLTFSNPTESCKQILSDYIDSIDLLFNNGLDRLIEGVAVQTNPLNLQISVAGDIKYELNHTVSEQHHNLIGTEIKLLKIENDIGFNQDELNIDIYVPQKLIACDYLVNRDHFQSNYMYVLVQTLADEYAKKLTSPSIKRILQTYSKDSGFEVFSLENINYAAQESINDIQSICMFDLTESAKSHYTLYSLFPINKSRNGTPKPKHHNRILFLGTYIMDQGREFMKPENRNLVLMRLQYESSLILKSILSDSDFRVKNEISNKIYIEILESFSNDKIDKDFIKSFQEEID